jgi:hypothetical protein
MHRAHHHQFRQPPARRSAIITSFHSSSILRDLPAVSGHKVLFPFDQLKLGRQNLR